MMDDTKHKLELIRPKSDGKYCMGITVCIDRNRINALGLYPVDKDGRRIDYLEEIDFECEIRELEVKNIEEIAFLMNEETFERFCELWREYHVVG